MANNRINKVKIAGTTVAIIPSTLTDTGATYTVAVPTLSANTTIEIQSNKATVVNVNSTDTQYPSAKAVYDAIPTLSGDAAVANVRKGKTFYNSSYTKQTGTMPDTAMTVSDTALAVTPTPVASASGNVSLTSASSQPSSGYYIKAHGGNSATNGESAKAYTGTGYITASTTSISSNAVANSTDVYYTVKSGSHSSAVGAMSLGTGSGGGLSGGGLSSTISVSAGSYQITPSVGGTGVNSTSQASFGMTTTKPSGTDGTNYITFDPDASVAGSGAFSTSATVTRASVSRATFTQPVTQAAGVCTITEGYMAAGTASITGASAVTATLAANSNALATGSIGVGGSGTVGETVNNGTNWYVNVSTTSATATAGTASATASVTKAASAAATLTMTGMSATTTNTGYYFTASASGGSGVATAAATATGGSAAATVTKGITAAANASKSGSGANKSATTTESTASASTVTYVAKVGYSNVTVSTDSTAIPLVTTEGYAKTNKISGISIDSGEILSTVTMNLTSGSSTLPRIGTIQADAGFVIDHVKTDLAQDGMGLITEVDAGGALAIGANADSSTNYVSGSVAVASASTVTVEGTTNAYITAINNSGSQAVAYNYAGATFTLANTAGTAILSNSATASVTNSKVMTVTNSGTNASLTVTNSKSATITNNSGATLIINGGTGKGGGAEVDYKTVKVSRGNSTTASAKQVTSTSGFLTEGSATTAGATTKSTSAGVSVTSAPTVTVSGAATGMATVTSSDYYVTVSGSGQNGVAKGTATATVSAITLTKTEGWIDGGTATVMSEYDGTGSATCSITPSISGSGTKVYIKAATSGKTDATTSATANAGTASATASITDAATAAATLSVTGMATTTTNTGYYFTASASGYSGIATAAATATGGSARASITASSASVTTGYLGTAVSVSTEASDTGTKTGDPANKSATTTPSSVSASTVAYIAKASTSATATAGTASATASIVRAASAAATLSVTGMATTTTNTGYYFTASATGDSGVATAAATATGGSAAATVTAGYTTGTNSSKSGENANKSATTTASTISASTVAYIAAAGNSVAATITNISGSSTISPGNVSIAENTTSVSGKTRVSLTPATSTSGISTYYAAVKASAAANLSQKISVSGSVTNGAMSTVTAGYMPAGTKTGSVTASGTATANIAGKDSDVYYLPIASAEFSEDNVSLTSSTSNVPLVSSAGWTTVAYLSKVRVDSGKSMSGVSVTNGGSISTLTIDGTENSSQIGTVYMYGNTPNTGKIVNLMMYDDTLIDNLYGAGASTITYMSGVNNVGYIGTSSGSGELNISYNGPSSSSSGDFSYVNIKHNNSVAGEAGKVNINGGAGSGGGVDVVGKTVSVSVSASTDTTKTVTNSSGFLITGSAATSGPATKSTSAGVSVTTKPSVAVSGAASGMATVSTSSYYVEVTGTGTDGVAKGTAASTVTAITLTRTEGWISAGTTSVMSDYNGTASATCAITPSVTGSGGKVYIQAASLNSDIIVNSSSAYMTLFTQNGYYGGSQYASVITNKKSLQKFSNSSGATVTNVYNYGHVSYLINDESATINSLANQGTIKNMFVEPSADLDASIGTLTVLVDVENDEYADAHINNMYMCGGYSQGAAQDYYAYMQKLEMDNDSQISEIYMNPTGGSGESTGSPLPCIGTLYEDTTVSADGIHGNGEVHFPSTFAADAAAQATSTYAFLGDVFINAGSSSTSRGGYVYNISNLAYGLINKIDNSANATMASLTNRGAIGTIVNENNIGILTCATTASYTPCISSLIMSTNSYINTATFSYAKLNQLNLGAASGASINQFAGSSIALMQRANTATLTANSAYTPGSSYSYKTGNIIYTNDGATRPLMLNGLSSGVYPIQTAAVIFPTASYQYPYFALKAGTASVIDYVCMPYGGTGISATGGSLTAAWSGFRKQLVKSNLDTFAAQRSKYIVMLTNTSNATVNVTIGTTAMTASLTLPTTYTTQFTIAMAAYATAMITAYRTYSNYADIRIVASTIPLSHF